MALLSKIRSVSTHLVDSATSLTVPWRWTTSFCTLQAILVRPVCLVKSESCSLQPWKNFPAFKTFPYLIPASEPHCRGLDKNCYTCFTDKESTRLRYLAIWLCCLSSRSNPECKLSGSQFNAHSRKCGYLFLNIQLS